MEDSRLNGEEASDLTYLLQAHARGEPEAWSELIERVYAELRSMAAGQLHRESDNLLFGPSALVNEAYLRLVGEPGQVAWVNRRHFFGAASEAMRRVLVDQARRRLAAKRGGGASPVPIDEVSITIPMPDEELLDLDAALLAFAQLDAEKAELVKLRFIVGLSESEAAETLGISRATAARHWSFARAWLFDWLKNNS